MQVSLLADLPDQITQGIDSAVGQRQRKEKEKLNILIGHMGIPGSFAGWEGEVSIKWIQERRNGEGTADGFWMNAEALRLERVVNKVLI